MNQETKKKILYVSPNGFLGGAERFVVDAIEGHSNSNKYKVDALFFKEGSAYNIVKSSGVDTFLLPMTFKLSTPIQLFKAACWIRSFIKKNNYDLVHSTMPYCHLVIGLSCFGLSNSPKKVWFQHGPVGGILDQLATIFNVDTILFNSKHTELEHEKTISFSLPKNENCIIPLGIKQEEIKEKITFDSEVTALMAGRICSLKGFDIGINALVILMKKEPSLLDNFSLKIIGQSNNEKDRVYEKALKEIVQENNLDKVVEFLGFKENLRDYLSAGQLFFHCSKTPEGFGLVVAEAMSAGDLIVGSNLGGTKEILSTGTGLIFDTTSEDAAFSLSVILEKYLIARKNGEYKKYLVLAESGKQHIHSRFSAVNMTKALEKLYLDIL